MDLQEILVDENATMIEAMEQLDRLATKVLFVVRDQQLVAALTDGDIRRWILKRGNLDAKVHELANYRPKFIYEKDKFRAKETMRQLSVEALPVLDRDKHLVSVIFWNENELTPLRELDIPVVIMAGGLGTRLYPYTKILPKPLIPVGEIPIVEHIVNKFRRFGVRQYHLIVNHKKNMIKAYFNEIEKDYDVQYADEDQFLGTGGGLSLLKGKINSTFILTNCDILVEEDYEKIYDYHKAEKNVVTMVCSLKNIQIPYGVVEIGEQGEIENMKEKPSFSFFTNTGMYVVEPSVIEELEANESIGFPDIISRHKEKGEKVGIYPISENAWLDMGQLDELEKMRNRLERDG